MALQIPDLSAPTRYAQTLKEAAQQQDDNALMMQERQLNVKRLQQMIDQTTKDQSENEQIKARLRQGGDPEDIAADIGKINPDKGAKYLQDLRANQAAQRGEAVQNLSLQQNQPGPMVSTPQAPVSVAAPQPQQAPIPTSLDASQTAAPPAQPMADTPLMRSIQLPNRWAPQATRPITIPSAAGGAPVTVDVPYLEEAQRRAQAAEQFKSNLIAQQEQLKPIVIGEGGTAVIPSLTGGAPTTIQGQPKLSDEEKEFFGGNGVKGWKDLNPVTDGHPSTLSDMQHEKALAASNNQQEKQLFASFQSHKTANDPDLAKYSNDPVGFAKWKGDTQTTNRITVSTATEAAKTGNDPRLVNVAPELRKDAVDSYGKAQDLFNKVATSTDNLKSVLDMAKSGNKEAQAAAPLVMVQTLNQLAEMRRLNPSEIANIKGAGSLIDSLQGKIGKIVSGKPIPDDILADASSLFAALSGNAQTGYQRSLQSINNRFRSTFTADDNGAPPASGFTLQYQGKTLTFPDQKSLDAAKAAAGIQ